MAKRLFSITWSETIKKKGGEKMKVIKPALALVRVDKAFAISARSERRNTMSCSCQCS